MNRLILALLCAGFIHTANAATPLPDWLRYYQMAAERGDPEAQMKMGWAYEKGDGVAKHSLHMEGLAIDIRVPGRELADVRRAALALAGGGVGYYPTSDFVHVDVGRVRQW